MIENPVPDLPSFSGFMDRCRRELPVSDLFAAHDLFRVLLVDGRVCSYFVEPENSEALEKIFTHVNEIGEKGPHALRIVSLHLACNFFSGPLSSHLELLSEGFIAAVAEMVSSGLLDSQVNVRVSAASLAFNLAVLNHRMRTEKQKEGITQDTQIQLVAAMVQALSEETASQEAATGLLLALAFLTHMAEEDGLVVDLCRSMGLVETVLAKKDFVKKSDAIQEAIAILTKALKP